MENGFEGNYNNCLREMFHKERSLRIYCDCMNQVMCSEK